MNRSCPACHVIFWKDPGESLGAMYLDYAVIGAALFASWALIAWLTRLTVGQEIVIISLIVIAAELILYPTTRSFWTLLVYLSGGIEKRTMRVIPGGKRSSEPPRNRRAAR